MTDEAFRFQFPRRDVSEPNGEGSIHYVAVAASYEAALALVAEIAPNTHGLKLVAKGPDVMAEAVKRGLKSGQAIVV